MSFMLKISSALNLTLSGSTGSFSAGTVDKSKKGIEVKYFLTHVGLDFENGANSLMLNHLAPVRELFEPASLEFDEIMQRDIDDARVSAELIPYLLDPGTRDLVKIFPPIIVVVLPTESTTSKPANKYPKVDIVNELIEGQNTQITRSGTLGQEVFQFQQPLNGVTVYEHDLNKLKLNTEKCKLVIVDGQHRAMALLAIYRNLKQEWSDARRAPYKDYYEEWTPKYIKKFELKKLSLPVMFCTFPELDESYSGDYDLKKAARSVFLTLNKTARKVSESRNRLLNDLDLVSLFLRKVLSLIKEKDNRSPLSLRIHNIELDQIHERVKIESPIAITGVNHVYYLIEHLLFNEGDQSVNGARPRTGKFFNRTDLSGYGALDRLGNARNEIGADEAIITKRDSFSVETGLILTKHFVDNLGLYIIYFFERFLPFEHHNKAVLDLDAVLRNHSNAKLWPILFGGQGLSQVFEKHRSILREKVGKNVFGEEATKIETMIANLDSTAKLKQEHLQSFRVNRVDKYIFGISDKSKLKINSTVAPIVINFLDHLYQNIFTSVAFQVAVVAGFLGEIEAVDKVKVSISKPKLMRDNEFALLLTDLNSFFVPKTSAQFRKLVSVFYGDLEGEIVSEKLIKTPHTFREVVFSEEMQPDQWPKYRYLILELWRPIDEDLIARIRSQRDLCRGQIFNSLFDKLKTKFLTNELKREEQLTSDDTNKLYETTYKTMLSLLTALGWSRAELPSIEGFKALATPVVGSSTAVENPAEEPWTTTGTDAT
jgi:hypothetical protein